MSRSLSIISRTTEIVACAREAIASSRILLDEKHGTATRPRQR
jgi:hypothetical protein